MKLRYCLFRTVFDDETKKVLEKKIVIMYFPEPKFVGRGKSWSLSVEGVRNENSAVSGRQTAYLVYHLPKTVI